MTNAEMPDYVRAYARATGLTLHETNEVCSDETCLGIHANTSLRKRQGDKYDA